VGCNSLRRAWIEPHQDDLSIVEQCELTGISRAGLYYTPVRESAENLKLMRMLDEQYTRAPFYGVRRMTYWLSEQGYRVNVKRVRRLLRQMGLEAIYPKPRLSQPAPGHRIYPYRLRAVKIERPNQVWASDITYVRLRVGVDVHRELDITVAKSLLTHFHRHPSPGHLSSACLPSWSWS
jgi:putative transposase